MDENSIRLFVAKDHVDRYEELRNLFANTQKLLLAAVAYSVKEGCVPISSEQAGGRSNKEIILSYVYGIEPFAATFLRSLAWSSQNFKDEVLKDESQYRDYIEGHLNAGVKAMGEAIAEEIDMHEWYYDYLKGCISESE